MQISIIVHEIVWQKNEGRAWLLQIEKFSVAFSNKFNSNHWKIGEMFEISLKMSKFRVYLLRCHIFHLYLII